MPNYVKNTLEISGQEKDIIEVLNRICDPEKGLGTIDFERIIPMPAVQCYSILTHWNGIRRFWKN